MLRSQVYACWTPPRCRRIARVRVSPRWPTSRGWYFLKGKCNLGGWIGIYDLFEQKLIRELTDLWGFEAVSSSKNENSGKKCWDSTNKNGGLSQQRWVWPPNKGDDFTITGKEQAMFDYQRKTCKQNAGGMEWFHNGRVPAKLGSVAIGRGGHLMGWGLELSNFHHITKTQPQIPSQATNQWKSYLTYQWIHTTCFPLSYNICMHYRHDMPYVLIHTYMHACMHACMHTHTHINK